MINGMQRTTSPMQSPADGSRPLSTDTPSAWSPELSRR